MTKISWLLGRDHYELKETIWSFQFGNKYIMTFSLWKELSNYLLEKNWSNQARRAASMATDALEDHRCPIFSFSILTDMIQKDSVSPRWTGSWIRSHWLVKATVTFLVKKNNRFPKMDWDFIKWLKFILNTN